MVDGLKRLPAGSQLVQIDGGVHSFFGRYGPQAGDGVPTGGTAARAGYVQGGKTPRVFMALEEDWIEEVEQTVVDGIVIT